jgi:hypothetical protein
MKWFSPEGAEEESRGRKPPETGRGEKSPAGAKRLSQQLLAPPLLGSKIQKSISDVSSPDKARVLKPG